MGDMTDLKDTLYTLPSNSAKRQYCYVVSFSNTSSQLHVSIRGATNLAPVGGTPFNDVTSDKANQMCPGDVRYYFVGKIVNGLSSPAGPLNAATIGGKGVQSHLGQCFQPSRCKHSKPNSYSSTCCSNSCTCHTHSSLLLLQPL